VSDWQAGGRHCWSSLALPDDDRPEMTVDEVREMECDISCLEFSQSSAFHECLHFPVVHLPPPPPPRRDYLNLCKSIQPGLWSLAGRYDNSLPTRFLGPTECLKIPALVYDFIIWAGKQGDNNPGEDVTVPPPNDMFFCTAHVFFCFAF
jgi:hypothetical protein